MVRERPVVKTQRVYISQKPKKTKAMKPKQSAFSLDTMVSRLGDPQFLLAAVVCGILALGHVQDPATSLVAQFAKWLQGMDSTKWVGDFLVAHATQAVGAACYVAVALLAAPERLKWTWAIVGAGMAFLLAEQSAYQYATLALIGCLYLRAGTNQMRTLFIIAGIGAYLLFLGGIPGTVTTPPATQGPRTG